MRKIFAFFIFIIIYGSLFPFTFSPHEGSSEQWDIFLRSYYPITSLGDILGNIALFIPFGYLGIECMRPSMRFRPAYLKILAAGILLAFILQLMQIYISSRSPAMADVYWNGAGIITGFILLNFVKKHFPKLSITEAANTPVILSFFWLLYLFFPFIPTLDFQEIKNGLKPLMLSQSFHSGDFMIAVSGWLLFAHFTRDFFHQKHLNRLILPIISIMSLPLRLIILNNSLDLSDVMAVGAALLIWFLFLKNRPNIARPLAYLIFFSIIVYSLGSLDFSPSGWHFSMIPFSGFLEGDLFSNTKALFFKLFLFGSSLWLLKIGWPHIRLKTVWLFLFILLLELLQIFMASRSAEITDPLLILLLSTIIHVKKARQIQTQDTAHKKEPVHRKLPYQEKPETSEKSGASLTKRLFLPLCAIVLAAFIISIIIKMPGVPYNVRELFLLDGLFISIIPFVLFIFWFGMSIPLITTQMLKKPNRHFIRLPLLVLGSGLVSYLLLRLSVTTETMSDITGSSNILWFVTNRHIWGDFGLLLAQIIPLPLVWAILENIVRFLVLFSPITFILYLFYYTGALVRKYDIQGLSNKAKLMSISLFLNTLYILPWLYLCKLIAFDYTSTDNLNELIARDGFLNLGGGGYLYLLVILLSLNSVWISQSLHHWAIKFLSIFVAGAAGWFLLNLGLETDVHKYGLTFSGVDFLLGPDRQHKLTQSALFMRWIILYIGCVITLVWGMKFNLLSLMADIKQKFKQNSKLAGE